MSNDAQLACVALMLYFVTFDYIATRSQADIQGDKTWLRIALLLMFISVIFPTMIVVPWFYEFTFKPMP